MAPPSLEDNHSLPRLVPHVLKSTATPSKNDLSSKNGGAIWEPVSQTNSTDTLFTATGGGISIGIGMSTILFAWKIVLGFPLLVWQA